MQFRFPAAKPSRKISPLLTERLASLQVYIKSGRGKIIIRLLQGISI